MGPHDTAAIDVKPDAAVRITAPAGALDINREFTVRRIDLETLPSEEIFDSFSVGVPLAAFDIDAGMEPDDLFVQPVRFAFDLDELNVPESLREHLEIVRLDSSGNREVLVGNRSGRWLGCDLRHNGVFQLLAIFTSLVPVLAAKDHATKWGGVGEMLGNEYGVFTTARFQIWFPARKIPIRRTPEFLEVQRILEEKKHYYLQEMQVLQDPKEPPVTPLDRLAMYAADEDVIHAEGRLHDHEFLVKYVLPYPVVHSLGALDRAGKYIWEYRKFRAPSTKIDVILPLNYKGGNAYGISDDGHFTYPFIHLNTFAIPDLPPETANPYVLDELDTTVLHELFHVVQKEYFNWSKYLSPGQIWGGNRYVWVAEATVLVLEEDAEPFYRSKGWTRGHFGKTFFAKTHMGWYKLPLDIPLDTESKAQSMGYGASRFLLALRDRYYALNPDAFLKRYLETFGTFRSPVEALSEVTSRSALVLGADFHLFCARHVDEIVDGLAPPSAKFALRASHPVARWPLEAAPLSSAIGIFDYSKIDEKQLGKALLVVRTDVADGVRMTTRYSQTSSKGWRTIDKSLPGIQTEANGHQLTVQRIDPSPGEWYSRPIASWFEEARTTVTLVEQPTTPPRVELLEGEGMIRIEFPESPLEPHGELLRREARIAFPNTRAVTIAFTEGRSGDVAWRQIAREGAARALKGMDPRIDRVFLPQDLDDMLAIWSAFRGVMGDENLNLEIRYRLVVKRREIDNPESTGVDGPWSKVFTVPIKAPMPNGHPGDVSGEWRGQVMLVHKPIRLNLIMDGLNVRGAILFDGRPIYLEGQWIPEEFGWKCILNNPDPDQPVVSFIEPYLRALPDGGLWLAAPPAVLRHPKPKTDPEEAGFLQRWLGG